MISALRWSSWPYDVLSVESAGVEVSPVVPDPLSPASSPAPGEGSSPWLTGGVSVSLRASRRARFWAAFSAFFRSRCRLAKVCWFFLAIRYEFASTRLLNVRAYGGRATPSITRSPYGGWARVSRQCGPLPLAARTGPKEGSPELLAAGLRRAIVVKYSPPPERRKPPTSGAE